MLPEQKSDHAPVDEHWSGDFRAAEDRLLDASLAATPSQRLAWLEEALQFAARAAALPKRAPAPKD
jgi:hypothetical protein